MLKILVVFLGFLSCNSERNPRDLMLEVVHYGTFYTDSSVVTCGENTLNKNLFLVNKKNNLEGTFISADTLNYFPGDSLIIDIYLDQVLYVERFNGLETPPVYAIFPDTSFSILLTKEIHLKSILVKKTHEIKVTTTEGFFLR